MNIAKLRYRLFIVFKSQVHYRQIDETMYGFWLQNLRQGTNICERSATIYIFIGWILRVKYLNYFSYLH